MNINLTTQRMQTLPGRVDTLQQSINRLKQNEATGAFKCAQSKKRAHKTMQGLQQQIKELREQIRQQRAEKEAHQVGPKSIRS